MPLLSSTGVTALLVDGRSVQGTVTIEQDMIDVTPEYEPDPSWVHTDSNGHVHRWMAGPDPLASLRNPREQTAELPSLVRVDDPEPHWCPECLGDYQPQHYECRLCRDVVTPQYRRTVGRYHIPGLKHMTIEVEEYLPLGDVTVRMTTDPPQTVRGRVVSSTVCGGSDGLARGTATIVPTEAPRTEESG